MAWRVNVPQPQPMMDREVDKYPSVLPPSRGWDTLRAPHAYSRTCPEELCSICPCGIHPLSASFPSLAHVPVLPPVLLVSPPKWTVCNLSHCLGAVFHGNQTRTEAYQSSATCRPYLHPKLNRPSVQKGKYEHQPGCQMILRNYG